MHQAEQVRAEGQLHQRTTELRMQLQQKGLQIQQKKAELEQENKHAYFRKKMNWLLSVWFFRYHDYNIIMLLVDNLINYSALCMYVVSVFT